jgi:hypothetical protein
VRRVEATLGHSLLYSRDADGVEIQVVAIMVSLGMLADLGQSISLTAARA